MLSQITRKKIDWKRRRQIAESSCRLFGVGFQVDGFAPNKKNNEIQLGTLSKQNQQIYLPFFSGKCSNGSHLIESSVALSSTSTRNGGHVFHCHVALQA